ncbi:MAG TPA: NTF2 fold immunity protein [Verrucomicrobiae bacterium]|nr:NTF2 fold immunity protein [Verrucomicrobiae bacterium]
MRRVVSTRNDTKIEQERERRLEAGLLPFLVLVNGDIIEERNTVMKPFSLAATLLAAILFLQAEEPAKHSYRPKQGYVPVEATAVAIAEAVLKPIYGMDTIKEERPFKAVLRNDMWIITGHFPKSHGSFGGVAEIELAKTEARILRFSRGK